MAIGRLFGGLATDGAEAASVAARSAASGESHLAGIEAGAAENVDKITRGPIDSPRIPDEATFAEKSKPYSTRFQAARLNIRERFRTSPKKNRESSRTVYLAS